MKTISRLFACFLTLYLLFALSASAQPTDQLVRAEALAKEGKNTEALNAFSAIIQSSPSNASALLGRARVHKAMKNSVAEAADLDSAVAVAPTMAEAWRRRALFRLAMKQFLEAQADAEQALKLAPQDGAAYALRGAISLGRKDYQGAVVDFDRALELKPNNAVYLSNRGAAREGGGDTDGALQDFEAATRLNPSDTFALGRQAAIYESRGRTVDALKAYQAILRVAPQHKVATAKVAALLAATTPVAAPSSEAPQVPSSGATSRTSGVPSVLDRVPAKTATATPAKTTSAPAAQPKPAPSPARVDRQVIAPSPPAPPATSQTVSTSVKRRSGYKLVRSSLLQLGERGTVSGGAEGSYHSAYNGHVVRWMVPTAILPGVPSKVRIQTTTSEGSGRGLIQLSAPEGRAGATIATAFVGMEGPLSDRPEDYLTKGPIPDRSVDEGAFTLPDLPEKPDAGDRWAPMPWVHRDIGKVHHMYGNASDARALSAGRVNDKINKTSLNDWLAEPGKVIPENVRQRTGYPEMVPDSAGGRYADLVLTVYGDESFEDSALAVHVYRWTADVGPVVDASDEAPERIELRLLGNGTTPLRVDGRDGRWVIARLAPKAGNPGAGLATASAAIELTPEGAGANWLGLSAPALRDGWKMIYIQASNPDPVRAPGAKPPGSVVLRARYAKDGRTLTQTVPLPLLPEATLDATPDLIEFSQGSGQTETVRIGVVNSGTEAWTFSAEFEKGSRPVATVAIRPLNQTQAEATLREAKLPPPEDGSYEERAVLRLLAKAKDGIEIERDIKVVIAQEGLFFLPTGRNPLDGTYQVSGDGSGAAREVDLRVFVRDAGKAKIVNLARTPGALSGLRVEVIEPEGSIAANAIEASQFRWEVAPAPRPLNEPTAILRFSLGKEVPGDGRVIPCDVRVSYPGRPEDAFSAIITLGIATTANGPGSSDWLRELDRTREIISKFVPPFYQAKLYALLDRQKMKLGAEGLERLRARIWRVAAELTLAEGGQGYADQAKWEAFMVDTLDWAQWAGDMAFGAVVGAWGGPYAAMGANSAKTAIISAINAYQDGRTPSEWLWENLSTIPGILEGKAIDVDTFEKLGMENRLKIWGLYIGYHFFKNLYLEKSIVQAAKLTAGNVTNNVLASWLGKEVALHGKQRVADWASSKVSGQPRAPVTAPVPVVDERQTTGNRPAGEAEDRPRTNTPTPTPAQEAEAVARVRGRVTQNERGSPYAHPQDVLAIMRDPSMVRALKTAPPEVQDAFENTRRAFYRQHDQAVVQHVKDTVPGMQNRLVKVMEFRTPGDTGRSLNTDRDYRVCYYAGRNAKGQEQWIEVPRQRWEERSHVEFSRATGGPVNSPAAAKEWAEHHQQLATDQYHGEASRAFSDQRRVWNERTRQFEAVQVDSNFKQVVDYVKDGGIRGKIDLADPASLSMMYRRKVGDARHPHEAFVQANKAVDALKAVRTSYNMQGRAIGVVPNTVLIGMEAVARANERLKADPNRRCPSALAEAERTLRAQGFRGLNDFMEKMGAQFESLKTMK